MQQQMFPVQRPLNQSVDSDAFSLIETGGLLTRKRTHQQSTGTTAAAAIRGVLSGPVEPPNGPFTLAKLCQPSQDIPPTLQAGSHQANALAYKHQREREVEADRLLMEARTRSTATWVANAGSRFNNYIIPVLPSEALHPPQNPMGIGVGGGMGAGYGMPQGQFWGQAGQAGHGQQVLVPPGMGLPASSAEDVLKRILAQE
ncbi:hypothetical protein BC831DRAFT_468029 [Entophlyctis helioformis]|nr:hypothetical protein BC831DRAFT_468029 [Entophlyctis helioformis]